MLPPLDDLGMSSKEMKSDVKNEQVITSVALCSYNGGRFIHAQLSSILGQTQLPDEVVICDDNSTDKTIEIIRRTMSDFGGEFKLVQNGETLGYARNFEKCISLCSGEIIFLSDQDDVWLPEKIAKTNEAMSRSPDTGMIFSDGKVLNDDLEDSGYTIYGRHGIPELEQHQIVSSMLKRDVWIKGCTMAVRSELRKYLFPVCAGLWGHDWWMAFVSAVISRITFLDEPLMLYRRHPSTSGADPYLSKGVFRTIRRHGKKFLSAPDDTEYRRWDEMAAHLEAISGVANDKEADWEEILQSGIEMVKKRRRFEKYRIELRLKNPLFRILPATKLFLSGRYGNYGYKLKSYLKDLVYSDA